jgi:hypothetical protein
MGSTLFGYISIPPIDMMWPRRLPFGIENWDFLGFKEIPYLLHF